MQTRNLTDAEIDRLGYEALVEKLGPVGATRFIGLWLERSGEDYAKADKPIDHMTVQEIYDEAVRLEAEREEGRNATGS
jgi:hypothetical protein